MKLVFLFVVALFWAHGVAAQAITPPRGYIVLNGGYQLTANDFADQATKRENAEDGQINSSYTVKAGPSF